MSDDYADLPDWIRPGAELAALGSVGFVMVTVTRITRTQIVTVWDNRTSVEYRFNRTPVPANDSHRPEPEYQQRGTYFGKLVQRSHPDITRVCIDRIARNAAHRVEEALKVYGNPRAAGDGRPVEERAMDLLDAIENAARSARRKVEQLNAPAAEHAQDLTASTTTPAPEENA